MSNQTKLTSYGRLLTALQTYFALTATIPSANTSTIPLTTVYGFLSRSQNWDGLTPLPVQDISSLKQVQKNMFVAKKINSSDVSPVIQRIDWVSGTVYDEYSDTVDMLATDVAGNILNHFYVKNNFDQVFKCLSNARGTPSTVEPFFQPGQYNTQNIFQGSDGYKWKFMYTLDIGTKIKFMDSNWIPVPLGVNVSPNSLASAEGAGGIEVINIINGGSNYSNSNTITVTVNGDGFGAEAQVISIDPNGSLVDVQVTNPGYNYTYANVSFTSASGTGATASSFTSPAGGHGFDPISELGCHNLMLTVEFDRNELLDGISYIPTDITYYQMGLVFNPVDAKGYPFQSNGTIYKTTTDLLVSQGTGAFQFNELLYQTDANNNINWTGTVLSFDNANSIINVINTTGVPVTGSQVFGQTSSTTRTLLTVTEPFFDIHSGYITYIQNLDGITRSSDGIEQYKMVLGN